MGNLPALPSIPQTPSSYDANSLGKYFSDLYRYETDLQKQLNTFLGKLKQNITNAKVMNGRVDIPCSLAIASNNQEIEIKNFHRYDCEIQWASCNFRTAATDASPTIQIRNATGGGGSGFTITLDAGTKKYGMNTGSVSIKVNGSLFLLFTDCTALNNGSIMVNFV